MGEGAMSPEVAGPRLKRTTTAPAVAILSPQDGATLASPMVTVTGSASDNVAVETVELSTDGTTWVLVAGALSWSANVTLHDGSNTVIAGATGSSGNAPTTTITVTVKLAMPP